MNETLKLEFESLEELDEILKGMSAALFLLGHDLSARMLYCGSNSIIAEKYSEEEEQRYFDKAKELYDTLTNFYDCMKENNND